MGAERYLIELGWNPELRACALRWSTALSCPSALDAANQALRGAPGLHGRRPTLQMQQGYPAYLFRPDQGLQDVIAVSGLDERATVSASLEIEGDCWVRNLSWTTADGLPFVAITYVQPNLDQLASLMRRTGTRKVMQEARAALMAFGMLPT